MSYTKHNFKSGQTLYASQLNEMDAQIETLSEKIENVSMETPQIAEPEETYTLLDPSDIDTELKTRGMVADAKAVGDVITAIMSEIATLRTAIENMGGNIATYTNLVPTSIDTDGSIFDGVGYRDGYRLSSSGSLSALAGATTTGFIKAKSTDIIRMSGVNWEPTSGSMYIMFYDASFTVLGSYNVSVNGETKNNTARGIVIELSSNVDVDDSGVTTFNIGFSDGSNVEYVRLNGWGSGADMIVTVNQEIK